MRTPWLGCVNEPVRCAPGRYVTYTLALCLHHRVLPIIPDSSLCHPHQSLPSQEDPERPNQKALYAPSPAVTPAESAARSPLRSPPSPPLLTLPTEMRRADECRRQLLHLRPSPSPMPRFRCQTSRVAAGNSHFLSLAFHLTSPRRTVMFSTSETRSRLFSPPRA